MVTLDKAALHLAAIVQSSDDAIVSKDLDGVVQSWNPAAERLFGYTSAEMVGRSIRTIIPADRQTEEDEVLRRIRLGERVEHFETVRRHKDGSLVDVSLTVSPIHTLDGSIMPRRSPGTSASASGCFARSRSRTASRTSFLPRCRTSCARR